MSNGTKIQKMKENARMLWQIVRQHLVPAVRESPWNLFWLFFVVGALLASVVTGAWNVAVWQLLYLMVWLQLLITMDLSGKMQDEHEKLMEMTKSVVDTTQYKHDQLSAVYKIIKEYEATGRYAVPTDVLLTEINRVEIPKDVIDRFMPKKPA